MSLPAKPSRRRFSTRRCRSLNGHARGALPEARFPQHSRKGRVGAVERATQAVEEPRQPRRNIERALLRALKDVVVGVPLVPDLR